MCIVCHYKGDNQLVTDRGHPGLCIQEGACIDCGEEAEANHVCEDIPRPRNKDPLEKPCPSCGAVIGEMCWTKGFDVYGPKARHHKKEVCRRRRWAVYSQSS